MVPVIRLNKLSKTYGRGEKAIHAVNQLSLEVDAGQVYGFLGPNGAGKTSTIRMLLNLIYPTSGQAYLFDTAITDFTPILRDKVGALVEEATFYPFMTGMDNLRVYARTSDYDDSKNHLQTILEMVGMNDYAKRKTKTYSTGMKQRLGVAAALLNDPDLLILDEPTSGLDPKGIQEMREMLLNLAKNEGKTIFLSSHLLHEVEQTCDRVAIIQHGKLIQEGTVSELLGDQSIIQIKATPISEANNLLKTHFSTQIKDDILEITAKHEDIPAIVQTLSNSDIAIYEVTQKRRSLEDLFLELTDD